MEALVLTGFTFGILYVLFGAPYMLAKGVMLMNEEDFSVGARLKAACPVLNIIIAERGYGRSFPVVGIFTLLTMIAFITNAVLMSFFPYSVGARSIAMMAFLLFVLITVIASIQLTYSIINVSDDLYGASKWAHILIYPLGYYYIGSYLYKYVIVDAARLNAVEIE